MNFDNFCGDVYEDNHLCADGLLLLVETQYNEEAPTLDIVWQRQACKSKSTVKQ